MQIKHKSNIPVIECPTPAIANSTMLDTKDKYVYQETVTIKCDTGYTITGQEQIQCQADKTWSSSICKSKCGFVHAFQMTNKKIKSLFYIYIYYCFSIIYDNIHIATLLKISIFKGITLRKIEKCGRVE